MQTFSVIVLITSRFLLGTFLQNLFCLCTNKFNKVRAGTSRERPSIGHSAEANFNHPPVCGNDLGLGFLASIAAVDMHRKVLARVKVNRQAKIFIKFGHIRDGMAIAGQLWPAALLRAWPLRHSAPS